MRGIILILSALALCTHATADDSESLQTLVVEGELIPQIGEVSLEDYTGSHTRIEREQLLRFDAPLAEIIAQQSGVQFRQSGGLGSYSMVTIRGASSAQTNVYLDGVLLNDASTGSVDFSQFELLNIGQVDIYRGATPVQLGHSNLGGAINLRTPERAEDSTKVQLGLADFGTRQWHIGGQRQRGRWYWQGALGEQQSDNDFEIDNDNGTPLNPNDDRRERRNNARFEQRSALIRAGYEQSADQRWDLLWQYSDREQGVPEWRNRADNRARYDTDSQQLQLNYRSANAYGDWSHNSGLFLNRHGEAYDDRESQVGLGAQHTRTDTEVLGARSYWEYLGERGNLSLHTQVRRERQDSDNLITDRDSSSRREQITSDAQYSWWSIDERWLLTPALHGVYTRDRYRGVLREGRERFSDGAVTAQLGAEFRPDDTWRWRMQLGQHQRQPSFFELFGDRGSYVGNHELREERSLNADVGVHWRAADQSLDWGATLFASQRDDLIASVYDARGIGRSENIGQAQVFGLELQGRWRWAPPWQWQLNLTWQDSENQTEIRAFNGKQLPGEATWAFYSRWQYQSDRWRLWYEINAERERFYDTANLLPAADTDIHSLGASYTRGAWRADAALHNLSDERVEDFNGFPKPGRSASLRVTYDF